MTPRRLRASAAALTMALIVSGAPMCGAAASLVATQTGAAPGPPTGVTSSELSAALSCPDSQGRGAPVLLVHGTSSTPEIAWSKGLQPLLVEAGFTVCTIRLPDNAVGDIDNASHYVVASIREMVRRYDEPVNLVGHSQGGMLLRWVLKWWPDTRSLVRDVVGLAPSNHGSPSAGQLCVAVCPAGIWQQVPDSQFLTRLNKGDDTPGRVAYSVIYSETDMTVNAPSPVLEGDRDDTNIAVQELCPGREVSHTQMQYDAVAIALVLDALLHDGPARMRRIPETTCAQKYARGIDEQEADNQQRAGDAFSAVVIASGEQLPAEPPTPAFAFKPSPTPRARLLTRVLTDADGTQLRMRAVGVYQSSRWSLPFATVHVAGRERAVDSTGRVTVSLPSGRLPRTVRLDARGLAPARLPLPLGSAQTKLVHTHGKGGRS